LTKLRFALVGCGRIASKHAQILAAQLPDAELVAVADIVPERAAAYGDKYRVPSFSSIAAMMESMRDRIDVVSILTPSGVHADNTVEAARYGKHIVVEKPMALTLDDADRMIGVCDAAGVKLFVVKQNRYNHPVRKLREALEAGRFGKLVMGTVRVRWCREQKYYDQDSWRGTWRYDGGVFTNQASHHIDLLEWMMGDVETVFAKAATRLVNIETEDTGAAVLRFANGALGIVEATTATRPKDLEGSISIMGERGTVEIGGFAVNKMKVWNFIDTTPEERAAMMEYEENPPNVYGFGHVLYLQNVIDAIRGRHSALVDGLEGRRSLELITALYESIETGRDVPLRFRPTMSRLGR
jgi:predicted dehydrogenase